MQFLTVGDRQFLPCDVVPWHGVCLSICHTSVLYQNSRDCYHAVNFDCSAGTLGFSRSQVNRGIDTHVCMVPS